MKKNLYGWTFSSLLSCNQGAQAGCITWQQLFSNFHSTYKLTVSSVPSHQEGHRLDSWILQTSNTWERFQHGRDPEGRRGGGGGGRKQLDALPPILFAARHEKKWATVNANTEKNRHLMWVRSKDWWETVVLKLFTDAEWGANVLMSCRSFFFLAVSLFLNCYFVISRYI